MNTPIPKPAVGIIGFGRFGPLLTRLLTEGYKVYAYDIEDITARAVEAGAEVADWDQITSLETLFLAVPIRHFKEVVSRLSSTLKPGTTVMDVCSVKVYPATVMKEHFPAGIHTIATHPLFGPDSGHHGFDGLPMMMSPVSADGNVFESWKNYFQRVGLRVHVMPPEEHDQLAARSQGITHFIGRVLQDYGITPTAIDTEGFKDLQLVVEQTCYDSIELFHDLENYNPYTVEMIDNLSRSINQVKETIKRRN
ncbi:MAG: prephenate dehydrogenase/arogenate dehydrogenase family protein [Candidatus Marinimicrobia bacterium]|nr:prephenate dehydrogenase/arogenate dehydrogenase family protein [Candidatus Neomarinimicrobiota bacterium]